MAKQLYVKHGKSVIRSTRGPEKDFPSWSAEYSHYVDGVFLDINRNKSSFDTFTVDFDVKKGDNVYVMALVFSSGDSFGTATGEYEIMWVFKNRLLAMEEISKFQTQKHSESVKITTDSGREVKIHNPSSGYFNKLERVQLHNCVVQ